MDLTDGQLDVIKAEGHLLVIGGQVRKTTISIIKAAQIIESSLEPSQKILFLSFARATVSRVVEAIEYEQRFLFLLKIELLLTLIMLSLENFKDPWVFTWASSQN